MFYDDITGVEVEQYGSLTDEQLGQVIETYPAGSRQGRVAQARLDERRALVEVEARVGRDRAWSVRLAEQKAERVAAEAERVEQLVEARLVRGEADFSSSAAPSGRGEPVDERTVEVEPVEAWRLVDLRRNNGRRLLYGLAAVRRVEAEKAERRRVMAEARRVEAERRAALVEVEVETLDPVAEVMAEVERGRYSLSSRPVVEQLYLRDDAGKVRASVTVEAPAWKVAAEALVEARERYRQSAASLMRDEPHGSGRAALAVRPASTVNGTEVRNAARWSRSTRDAIMTRGEQRGAITCVHPVDWSPYRVEADGTRTRLVSTATAKRRKVAAEVSAALAERRERDEQARARLVERLAAIGHETALDAARSSS